MPLIDYRDYPLECNGHTYAESLTSPTQGTHHVRIIKGQDIRSILEAEEIEALNELEAERHFMREHLSSDDVPRID